MALDIHRVRQVSKQAERDLDDARRRIEAILSNFQNLGSGFTGDRLYSREYSALNDAVKQAARNVDRVKAVVRDIERKA